MSEFGNETATAVFNSTGKTLSALLKLLQHLIDRYENQTQRKLQKEQLKVTTENRKHQELQKQLANRSGYINLKTLLKTGEKICPISTTLAVKQAEQFAYYAKKYGLIYSAVSDKFNGNDNKERIILVREKDLQLVKDITDRMNENLKLKSLDDKLNEVINEKNISQEDLTNLDHYLYEKEKILNEGADENQLKIIEDKIAEIMDKNDLSQEDVVMIDRLLSEKEQIIRDGTDTFNELNEKIIFDDICGKLQSNSLSFDRALNRITDRDFSKDIPYYVCERTNPTKYIELNSTLDNYNNQEYTRTDYKVYKDDVYQEKYTDERFDGRPWDYWTRLKETMKEVGEFSDDIIIFNTKDELDAYKKIYFENIKDIQLEENQMSEVSEEILDMETPEQMLDTNNTSNEVIMENSYRDYNSMIEELKVQLKEQNLIVNSDDKLQDVITKKEFNYEDCITEEEFARYSDGILIKEQIINYEKMNDVQTMLAMDKEQYIANQEKIDNGLSPELKTNYETVQSALLTNISECEAELNTLSIKEDKVMHARYMVTGIRAANEVEAIHNDERNIQKDSKNSDLQEKRTKINQNDNSDRVAFDEMKKAVKKVKETTEKSNKPQEIKNNTSKTAVKTKSASKDER